MDRKQNISGTYGNINVQDRIDTNMYFSATQILASIFFILLLAGIFGIAKDQSYAGLGELTLTLGAFAGILLVVGCVYEASRPRLLLNTLDSEWVVEKRFPLKSIEHGNTLDLKEIRMTCTGSSGGVVCWSPILEWRTGYQLDWFPRTFALGQFWHEHEARAFAEELASRLGIPVEPERCEEILGEVSNWFRRRPRTG